ncbi:hypothetical protein GCM10009785_12100 [Brooklawnia cerclae]|uniref:Uncharacterized protein n=1 Tax=Brooklawnia cerclae TaxID=349934 RepID=A0ABX0SJJ6_9ACTN|nr:hypothetical protein [Brooklawnia cerclae]NIH58563.1 hypothetical protein [Brooklawnia cerclae]
MSAPAWEPPGASVVERREFVRTGPSGLLIGPTGDGHPITVRIFRPEPTRVLVSTRDYMKWVLVFRAVTLGAHVTVVTSTPRVWESLVRVIQGCGGTIDVLPDARSVPGQGRPYRPSLVVDDLAQSDGIRMSLGAWQAVLVLNDAASGTAIHALRSCDLALVSPCDARVAENLRRGYVLTAQQLRQVNNLAENEVVVAMPRRVSRVLMPPTPTEYELLFRA